MMEKLKLTDKKQYLLKIDKPRSIKHNTWIAAYYHEEHDCFNLNPAISFEEVSECIDIEAIAKLEYHKQTTIGLYAIDFNPRELIKRFVDSQSDACRLVTEDVEDLIVDWNRWLDNKNKFPSPFHKID